MEDFAFKAILQLKNAAEVGSSKLPANKSSVDLPGAGTEDSAKP